jgi:6,7-dimethyl-8-ribityllumazine synthase
VAARFNEAVVDRLVAGARQALEAQGVLPEDIRIERVPGAWEIPQGLAALARSGSFDALVALGAVVRGETAHFEYISAECARGVAEVARSTGLPVTFGVLTCETMEQALARAGGVQGNKGEEAALAALEMAELIARLGS